GLREGPGRGGGRGGAGPRRRPGPDPPRGGLHRLGGRGAPGREGRRELGERPETPPSRVSLLSGNLIAAEAGSAGFGGQPPARGRARASSAIPTAAASADAPITPTFEAAASAGSSKASAVRKSAIVKPMPARTPAP